MLILLLAAMQCTHNLPFSSFIGTEDLTSTGIIKDMDAIPVNDNGVQHFPYEVGTAVGMCS